MDKRSVIVGMDAGGTKTKIDLADETGLVFDSFLGEGMNINSFGKEGTAEHLRAILKEVEIRLGSFECVKGMCIGTAGASNPDTQKVIAETVMNMNVGIEPLIIGDNVAALYGSEGTGEGIILIAGTGSVCTGRRLMEDGREILGRSGGWGHLIDDEGSGYAIGRDVLSAVVRSVDGRDVPSVMWDEVKRQLKIDSMPELIRFVYGKDTGKKEIAALAPIVMKGVEAGEEAAGRILEKAAVNLSDMVCAVAAQLGKEEAIVSLCGSVLTKNDLLRSMLETEMAKRNSKITVGFPRYDAAQGAVFAAVEALSAK